MCGSEPALVSNDGFVWVDGTLCSRPACIEADTQAQLAAAARLGLVPAAQVAVPVPAAAAAAAPPAPPGELAAVRAPEVVPMADSLHRFVGELARMTPQDRMDAQAAIAAALLAELQDRGLSLEQIATGLDAHARKLREIQFTQKSGGTA
jgi:hypothetical protein